MSDKPARSRDEVGRDLGKPGREGPLTRKIALQVLSVLGKNMQTALARSVFKVGSRIRE